MLISREYNTVQYQYFAASDKELGSFIENALAIADFIYLAYNTVILNVRIKGQTWSYIIICRMTPTFPENRKNTSIILYDIRNMGMTFNVNREAY